MQRFEMAADPHDPAGLRWLETLLPGIYMLSGFGGLITFTTAVGIYGGPRRYYSELQTFISLAWLFFVLSLALATLTSMALTFQRHHVKDAFERGYKSWRGGAGTRTAGERGVVFGIVVLGAGLWLMLLVCLAFVFLSLSIAAYSLAIGWIAVVVSGAMLVTTIVFWVLMNQKD